MYVGEVNIPQDSLAAFLKTAKQLQVKGLTEGEVVKSERNIFLNWIYEASR